MTTKFGSICVENTETILFVHITMPSYSVTISTTKSSMPNRSQVNLFTPLKIWEEFGAKDIAQSDRLLLKVLGMLPDTHSRKLLAPTLRLTIEAALLNFLSCPVEGLVKVKAESDRRG